MQRVDYLVGGRKTFHYSSNLSASGLFLHNATQLEPGQRLNINLHLKNRPEPLALEAMVQRVGAHGTEVGTGLAFVPGQDRALAIIREFIRDELITKLEASLKRSLSNTNNLVQLCNYYIEVEQIDEAIALYRRGIEASPNKVVLFEGLVQLLLARARERGVDAGSSLDEIEALLVRGETAGSSERLGELRKQAADLHHQLERRSREHSQQEEERKRRDAQAQADKVRQSLVKELQTQAEKELAARRRELEREVEAKQAKLARAQQALDAHLTKAAAEMAALEAERERDKAVLATREQEIATLRSQLGELPKMKAALEQTNTARAQLESKLREAEADLAQAGADLERRRHEVAAVVASEAALRQEVARLHGAREARATLETEVAQLRSERGARLVLEREMAQLRAERQVHLSQVGTAADLEKERLRLGAEARRLSELTADLDRTKAALERERAATLAASEKGHAEQRLLELERRDLEETRQAIQVERHALEGERRALDDERRNLGEARRDLEVERHALDDARQTLDADGRALAQARERAHLDREQLETLRNELAATQNTLARANEALTTEFEHSRVTEDELTTARAEIARLRAAAPPELSGTAAASAPATSSVGAPVAPTSERPSSEHPTSERPAPAAELTRHEPNKDLEPTKDPEPTRTAEASTASEDAAPMVATTLVGRPLRSKRKIRETAIPLLASTPPSTAPAVVATSPASPAPGAQQPPASHTRGLPPTPSYEAPAKGAPTARAAGVRPTAASVANGSLASALRLAKRLARNPRIAAVAGSSALAVIAITALAPEPEATPAPEPETRSAIAPDLEPEPPARATSPSAARADHAAAETLRRGAPAADRRHPPERGSEKRAGGRKSKLDGAASEPSLPTKPEPESQPQPLEVQASLQRPVPNEARPTPSVPEATPRESAPATPAPSQAAAPKVSVAAAPVIAKAGRLDNIDPSKPVEFEDAMTKPVFISGPNPEYTARALEREVEGVMVVKCTIDLGGNVHNCRVLKNIPLMERAVVNALEKRRYKPATYGGKPLTVDYTFTINLVLPRRGGTSR